MSELMRQLQAENNSRVVRQADRALLKEAVKIRNEVRRGAAEAEGQVVLAAHIMGELADLDATRKSLSTDDAGLNQMLVEVEVAAFRGTRRIQDSLFSGWDL